MTPEKVGKGHYQSIKQTKDRMESIGEYFKIWIMITFEEFNRKKSKDAIIYMAALSFTTTST